MNLVHSCCISNVKCLFYSKMHSLVILFITVTLAIVVNGGQILAITPLPSYSHNMFYACLFRKLNQNGHNITVLTGYPITDRFLENYTEIYLSYVHDHVIASNVNEYNSESSWINDMENVWSLTYIATKKLLQDKAVTELFLHGNTHKFDLVILEHSFSPNSYSISWKLKVPYICKCNYFFVSI